MVRATTIIYMINLKTDNGGVAPSSEGLGSRSLRNGARKMTMTAMWRTSAAMRPGVRYRIQGLRRSVGVRSTRRARLRSRYDSLCGVVIALEEKYESAIGRQDWKVPIGQDCGR